MPEVLKTNEVGEMLKLMSERTSVALGLDKTQAEAEVIIILLELERKVAEVGFVSEMRRPSVVGVRWSIESGCNGRDGKDHGEVVND